MSDYRSHLYSSYTTSQSRTTSLDEIKTNIAVQKDDLRTTIVPDLPKHQNARIVDLGCGYGACMLLLAELGYTNTVGIDISETQISTAKQLGAPNVHVGNIMEYVRTTEPADVVIMMDVIEHLTRDELITLLTSIKDILKPGGVFIARTPNVDAPLGTVLSFGDMTHELHLNKLSALELFTSLKFDTVEVRPVFPRSRSLIARILRASIGRCMTLWWRLLAITQGISNSHRIHTINMLIVARRAR